MVSARGGRLQLPHKQCHCGRCMRSIPASGGAYRPEEGNLRTLSRRLPQPSRADEPYRSRHGAKLLALRTYHQRSCHVSASAFRPPCALPCGGGEVLPDGDLRDTGRVQRRGASHLEAHAYAAHVPDARVRWQRRQPSMPDECLYCGRRGRCRRGYF